MNLIKLLRTLEPSGDAGLEGLVSRCIGAAFQQDDRTEDPGPQKGRDAALFDPKTGLPSGVGIEVKRYNAKSALRERELLGEITQVRRVRKSTHTWILVATKRVPAGTVEELVDEGFRNGLNVVVLDSVANGFGNLEVLLASQRNAVLDWVGRHDQARTVAWGDSLDEICRDSGFVHRLLDMRARLSGPYSARLACAKGHEWLREKIDSQRKRIAGFNQQLGRQGKAPHVPRPQIEAAIEAWFSRPPGRRILALLGGEGDGKTWAALDALLTAGHAVPLVVTSNLFDDTGVEGVLAEALHRQCGGDYDHWRNLLTRRGEWPSTFQLLILVDGLNEAPSVRSDMMIQAIMDGRWGSATDIIVTCRKPFWDTRIEPVLRTTSHELREVTVGAFDRVLEWPVALGHLGPAAEALPPNILLALRNPRLWSFAFDLRDRIGGMGEITLERLLVEHWRMRYSERSDLAVDWLTFNRLVARSVRNLREKSVSSPFERGTLDSMIKEMTGLSQDLSRDLGEIQDGVFYQLADDGLRLQIRPERVPIALGLLLAQDVLDVTDEPDTRKAVQRAAGRLIDDLPASDRVELILRTAVFTVLAMTGRARRALPSLLRYWVSLQNREEDFYHALSVVTAAAPDAFIEAIEDEKREDEIVGEEILDELVTVLIGRRDMEAVRVASLAAVERWFKSIPVQRYSPKGYESSQLIASEISYVEMLDDAGAELLAFKPISEWGTALANWSRRRAYLDDWAPDDYRYFLELDWLGWSNRLTDDDVEAVLSSAATTGGWSQVQADTLRRLMAGDTFAENCVAQELDETPWEDTEKRFDKIVEAFAEDDRLPFDFMEVYPDEGDLTEAWLQLEKWILHRRPEMMGYVLSSLRDSALGWLDGRTPAGFAQFCRDHALFLGEDVLTLVENYVRVARGSVLDRSGGHFAGRALASAFVVLSPEQHNSFIEHIGLHPQVERIDFDGYAGTESMESVPASENKSAYFTWFSLVSTVAPPPTGEEALQAYERELEDTTFGSRALLAVARIKDQSILNRFGARLIESRLPRQNWAPKAFATIVLAARPAIPYRVLRQRLRAEYLAQAAEQDGSQEALHAFGFDFQAGLGRYLPTWTPFVESLGILPPEEDLFTDGRGAHAVSAAETARGLRLMENAYPGFVDHLCTVLDGTYHADLSAVEGSLCLLTALAGFVDEARLVTWLGRAGWNVPRSNHLGLSVCSPLVYAFSKSTPSAMSLRDVMFRSAWTDGDLLDLVCVARLAGEEAWLTAAYEALLDSDIVNERAKAILILGWFGHATLGGSAEVADLGGYIKHAIRIADRRAVRLHLQRQALGDYLAAEDDKTAWLAYRRLSQEADRRLVVELRAAQPQIDAQPRGRRVQLQLMASEFERLFRRNEGMAERLFAGAAAPHNVPPWGTVNIYEGSQGRAG